MLSKLSNSATAPGDHQSIWEIRVVSFRFTDVDMASLLDEVYVALNNDLRVLAAIGIRTVFDRATELLGVDPGLRFFEKLGGLLSLGVIGKSEKDIFNVLTDAESAAAHRGWKPTPHELDTMISMIENFLYRSFIVKHSANRLRASYPKKGK
jgi:hypothetical protein